MHHYADLRDCGVSLRVDDIDRLRMFDVEPIECLGCGRILYGTVQWGNHRCAIYPLSCEDVDA